MTLSVAGSSFFSQIDAAGIGAVHDLLITGDVGSTTIAISADPSFLNDMESVILCRDSQGFFHEIDVWRPIMTHFACQIRSLGAVNFRSIVTDDVRDYLLISTGEVNSDSMDRLTAQLFTDAMSLEDGEGTVANNRDSLAHWMQFTISPLLLSPLSLSAILQEFLSSDGQHSPVILRFRRSPTQPPLRSDRQLPNQRALVLVSDEHSRVNRITRDLKQIRRSLGPMGALQRSLLVPILETVCAIAERTSTQSGER